MTAMAAESRDLTPVVYVWFARLSALLVAGEAPGPEARDQRSPSLYLLAPERVQGIDARRPQRRQPRRDGRDDDEPRRHERVDQRIESADAE